MGWHPEYFELKFSSAFLTLHFTDIIALAGFLWQRRLNIQMIQIEHV
jgi:hypothetical protein